jgi:hypothetical protein
MCTTNYTPRGRIKSRAPHPAGGWQRCVRPLEIAWKKNEESKKTSKNHVLLYFSGSIIVISGSVISGTTIISGSIIIVVSSIIIIMMISILSILLYICIYVAICGYYVKLCMYMYI